MMKSPISNLLLLKTAQAAARTVRPSALPGTRPLLLRFSTALAKNNNNMVQIETSRSIEQSTTGSTPAPSSVNTDNNKKPRSRGSKLLQETHKDPIVVTDAAAARLSELLAGENAAGAVGIRLGVRRRGCNGLSYTLNYATESNLSQKDIAMTTPQGIRVFIEPMALLNVIGTTMDWEEKELVSEFTFNNPNSKGQCGCGESFNV